MDEIKVSPLVQEGLVEKKVDLVGRFVNELSALGGLVLTCDLAGLSQAIVSLARERGASELLAWEAEHLPAGLAVQLEAEGLRLVHCEQPADVKTQLKDLKIGLTGALGAIAESGSLALGSGPGRPQTAAILPETHIAILSKRDIHSSLTEVLNQPGISDCAAAVLISGPSRTADIEMTLTIGVHGPRELIVLLI